MSPINRLARRRALPLPMIFGPSRFAELNEIMDDALGLLPEFPEIFPLNQTGLFPAVNVTENPSEFLVSAELPGLEEKDVTVDFTDGVLTIKGDKTEEKTAKEDGIRYHLLERKSGTFQRSFPFPGGIADDKISADFKHGILTVKLPKALETQEKRRAIKINAH